MSCAFRRDGTRRGLAAALGVLAGVGLPLGCASDGAGAEGAAPAEEAAAPPEDWPRAGDDVLYVYGAMVGGQFALIELDAEELDALQEGLRDAALEKPLRHHPDDLLAEVVAFREARLRALAERERLASQPFLEAAAREPGAERLESGLIFTRLERGSGEPPGPEDAVLIHYEGTLRDGSPFRASLEEPARFPLVRMTRCWREGLQRMRPGGRARLVCPSEIAYGDRGVPPTLPGGAVVVFEIELLEVERGEAASAPGSE